MDHTRLADELGRFADLDWPVTQSTTDKGLAISFRQRGHDVRVTVLDGGSVLERRGDIESTFNSYRGLLASEPFGDLRQLARMQLALLPTTFKTSGLSALDSIPITGDLSVESATSPGGPLLDQIDDWTASPGASDDIHALVIDGPAGIGKTHLIRSLVHRRASAFGPASRPLLLHVQSQGRQLTTLPDLLARTLQSMRLLLTYDQVPILVRHGLVQVAIDGFDELADPNGYETAWRSLRDLLEEIRGHGVLVLAGRDTFIDADSVRRALPILSATAVASIHLRPPTTLEASAWLLRTGLSEAKRAALESARLLEPGSYALRPFFLRQIREVADSTEGMTLLTTFPLGTLVTAMVQRELPIAKSLGLGISEELLESLLGALFQEFAREMADSESDSIDTPSMQLIAEIVFGPYIQEDALRALRNRVKSIALLDADSVPERRRFVHSEVQSYFLSRAYLQLLSGNQVEVSRSMRRSILGSELLETFHDVNRAAKPTLTETFRHNAMELLNGRRYDDRSPANISALLLASLDASQTDGNPIIVEDVALDECLLRGTTGPAIIRRTTISKLDARSADLSEIAFEGTTVVSLVADAATRFPNDVPLPQILTVDADGHQRTMFVPGEIRDWLTRESQRTALDSQDPLAGSATRRLLDKICRTILRQTWIRDIEDDRAGKLLRDSHWPALRTALDRNGLLEERTDVPAGGHRSRFVRVRRARDVLNADFRDTAIAELYRDLAD